MLLVLKQGLGLCDSISSPQKATTLDTTRVNRYGENVDANREVAPSKFQAMRQ